MAEATATMSGANEGAATAAQERVQDVAEASVVDEQPAAQSSSLPPAGDDKTAAAAAAAPTETAKEGDAAGLSAPSGGVLQAPRPPPAAVTRGRSDSLSIHPDDEIAPTSSAAGVDVGVVCNITLLLPTGARHPFRIDERYLAKRNVEVPDVTEAGRKDPFSISVYKLKELILREWRDDWDGKPASPSSIRLIHFGKLLDDKEQLRKYHFSAEAPNVVHMSVKPPEMLEDEEAAKGKSGSREARSRDSNTGCCVIL